MCHKMRVVERKRMSLLARQSERKWRNACETCDTHRHTHTHTDTHTDTQALEEFVNR